jgi:DNA polymerase-3 subunit epsilon
LLDAELLAQVYLELVGGRQVGLELAGAPTAAASNAVSAPAANIRPARAHAPSDAELAAHNAAVAKLKNPLWLN